nr:hypothetical protein [Arthrobacter sp. JCM 19049]
MSTQRMDLVAGSYPRTSCSRSTVNENPMPTWISTWRMSTRRSWANCCAT